MTWGRSFEMARSGQLGATWAVLAGEIERWQYGQAGRSSKKTTGPAKKCNWPGPFKPSHSIDRNFWLTGLSLI